MITDGDAGHVRGQVSQGSSSVPHGLRVDQPSFLPDSARYLVQQARPLHQGAVLSPKDLRRRINRDEEIATTWEPRVSILADGASRDQEVHMGMVTEVPAPCMQNTGHAEFRRTDVFTVLGQLDQRTISGLEECFVTFSGMRSNEASKLLRNREGDHEIRARQGPFKLFLKPCLGFGALTRRTMSIATRLGDLVDVSTVLASVDHET